MPQIQINPPSTLDPQGPAADAVARLWWEMFGLGAIVFGVVVFCLAIALFRRRQNRQDLAKAAQGGAGFVLLAGVGMPLVVLALIFVGAIRTQYAVSTPALEPAVTVEVVGYQWWWQVVYPDAGIVTANEIHIPVGEPVHVRLRSTDVIHSFWIPDLQGKIDLVPGQENEIWLEAEQPGIYRGFCAEFCGIQHANMMFLIIAEPQDEFAAWVEHHQQPAAEPDSAEARRGQEVFLEAGCDYCHTIQGAVDGGESGPDLTHFDTRETLAAAILPNTSEILADWIVNAQHLKPGNLMPSHADLSEADLQALLTYLEQLD